MAYHTHTWVALYHPFLSRQGRPGLVGSGKLESTFRLRIWCTNGSPPQPLGFAEKLIIYITNTSVVQIIQNIGA